MTKFAEMTPPQRDRWLSWANSHDWGGDKPARFVDHSEHGIVMETTCGFFSTDQLESEQIETAHHATPADLRAWAGY